MFTNRTCLLTVLGGMCRFWQGNTISYYTLKYFAGFGNESLFSVLYALCVVVGGFGSQLISGRISDSYEKHSWRTKPYVCVGMSLAAAVFTSLAFLF
jgi:hypothetical protein